MFYSRRINTKTQQIEVWECEWLSQDFATPEKCFIRKVGNEEEIEFSHTRYTISNAICWAPSQTIGNIALNYEEICGAVTTQSGHDIVTCQIIPAGKFRNGARRWYCKIHQTYWGTKADYATARQAGRGFANSTEVSNSASTEISSGARTEVVEVSCHQQQTKMCYVINPLELVFSHYDEIKVCCLLPPALSSEKIYRQSARIQVYKKYSDQRDEVLESIVDALIFSVPECPDIAENLPVRSIQVTPPAAFEFVRSLFESRELSCVSCKKCGYPHLDLGSFAINAHRKHFCGNCGNDNIWTKTKTISTPLKLFYDQYNNSRSYVVNDKVLSLDDYQGYKFKLWVSTPALVWTSTQSQAVGLRVHVYDGEERIIDELFSTVIHEGVELDREEMWALTLANIID